VFATEIATVGDVDRADGKLRETKDEYFGGFAKLCEFPADVHFLDRIYKIKTGLTRYLLTPEILDGKPLHP
jgi:hypothetical protein